MAGLFLYIFGGCGAGLIDNIWIVLIFRALVGCGVGLIMPMSTGLLTFYFPPEETDRLMGLSSAMNQMGGAVATFIAGILATTSWRSAFLVYLMGLISVVLCALFMPNDYVDSRSGSDSAEKESRQRRRHNSNANAFSGNVSQSVFIAVHNVGGKNAVRPEWHCASAILVCSSACSRTRTDSCQDEQR